MDNDGYISNGELFQVKYQARNKDQPKSRSWILLRTSFSVQKKKYNIASHRIYEYLFWDFVRNCALRGGGLRYFNVNVGHWVEKAFLLQLYIPDLRCSFFSWSRSTPRLTFWKHIESKHVQGVEDDGGQQPEGHPAAAGCLLFLFFFNLLQIVDKTILFHDKDNNGKINFEEFCEVLEYLCWNTFASDWCGRWLATQTSTLRWWSKSESWKIGSCK